jgi:hypothetical protein
MSYAANNPDCMPPAANRSSIIQNANVQAQYYPCGLAANSMFSGILLRFKQSKMKFLI